jgi:hypothetical protein
MPAGWWSPRASKDRPLARSLDDVVGRRLLGGAVVDLRVGQHDDAVFGGEPELVVRHAAEQAVHRRRGADAQPERQASDDGEGGAPRPQAQREAKIGEFEHDLLLPGTSAGASRRSVGDLEYTAGYAGIQARTPTSRLRGYQTPGTRR